MGSCRRGPAPDLELCCLRGKVFSGSRELAAGLVHGAGGPPEVSGGIFESAPSLGEGSGGHLESFLHPHNLSVVGSGSVGGKGDNCFWARSRPARSIPYAGGVRVHEGVRGVRGGRVVAQAGDERMSQSGMLPRVNRESVFSFYPNHFECDKASIVFGLPFGSVFVLFLVLVYLWTCQLDKNRVMRELFLLVYVSGARAAGRELQIMPQFWATAAVERGRAAPRVRAIRAVRGSRICPPFLLSGCYRAARPRKNKKRLIPDKLRTSLLSGYRSGRPPCYLRRPPSKNVLDNSESRLEECSCQASFCTMSKKNLRK